MVKVEVVVTYGDDDEVRLTATRDRADSVDGWITLNAELAMVGACRSILAKLTALHGDARDDPRMDLLPSERVRVLTSPTPAGETR